MPPRHEPVRAGFNLARRSCALGPHTPGSRGQGCRCLRSLILSRSRDCLETGLRFPMSMKPFLCCPCLPPCRSRWRGCHSGACCPSWIESSLCPLGTCYTCIYVIGRGSGGFRHFIMVANHEGVQQRLSSQRSLPRARVWFLPWREATAAARHGKSQATLIQESPSDQPF